MLHERAAAAAVHDTGLPLRLLSIDTYKDGGDPFNQHESLLYQMQYLFGQLQESEQQAVSPLGLCHAFKDLDGKPTDVRVQDDSGGFVQKLLDRLCMSCKALRSSTPFHVCWVASCATS